jgi:DNA-directed RNA polymerase subunit alpha
LSRLTIPTIKCIEANDTFGRFIAEPLEKGFGTTLGNSLRLVLLGYLTGAAVTWVEIEGIQHEFSTIPYVKEDTQICAADIKPSTDFEVINPELHLITLDSPEAKLYVEFNVELGEGYRQAESSDNMPVGAIPMDAIFSPVRKVNLTVESIHIGQETSRERLCLEVWTNGTISPVDAISLSAEILINQLSPFVEYVRVSQMEEEKQLIRRSIPDEQYNMPVEQLDLSVRTLNSLRRGNITTVGELITKGEQELLSLRNFGQKSKQELDERLKSLGLSLLSKAEEEEEHET